MIPIGADLGPMVKIELSDTAFSNCVSVVRLYFSVHLGVSFGLGKHPFDHSQHSGELQKSSTGALCSWRAYRDIFFANSGNLRMLLLWSRNVTVGGVVIRSDIGRVGFLVTTVPVTGNPPPLEVAHGML